MTIEAQGTLPAGWYSDPAQTGGDRWWDGTGWTEHQRPPVHVIPTVAMPDFSAPPTGSVYSPMTAPTPTAQVAVVPAPVAVAPVAAPAYAPTFAPAAAPVMTPTYAPTAAPVDAPVFAPAPVPVAPAAFVPSAPVAPVATGPVPLAPLGRAPIVPVMTAYETSELHGAAVQMHFDPEVSNGSALLSILFGVIAVGLAASATNVLPFPQVWVSAAAVIAMIFGVRALVRLRAQLASNKWAPVVGILLGIVATASVFFGGAVMSLVSSVVPQQTALTTPAAAPFEHSTVPLNFPLNSSLTAQEKSAQSLATAINHLYAADAAKLSAGQAWPASLQMKGNVVLANTGARLATIPAGETVSYTLAPDGQSYTLAVIGANSTQVANYGSQLNAFSYACATSDETCTPSN